MNQYQVGSIHYVRQLRRSGLTAHQQLDQMINHDLRAFIDENGFLQLPSVGLGLTPTLAPTSYFYAYLRDLVIAAYRLPAGLAADQLGRQLHLFRSYLDRQNINFIRQYRATELPTNFTDWQRLMCYLHDNHLKADFRTGASFHNRYHQKFDYPRNLKVQLVRNSYRWTTNPARMIEFIIDLDRGCFVSQWNVYRRQTNGLIDTNPAHYSPAELYQVANTESFNYGLPYGGYWVPRKYRGSHQRLDINQPPNSRIRRTAKNYWIYPHDYSNNGRYADIIKSQRDIECWRKIPAQERMAVYDAYLTALQRRRLKKKGISSFLAHSEFDY